MRRGPSLTEERFERARQTIGLFLGQVLFLVMYFAPPPMDTNQQTLLAAILSITIVCWLSEAIPYLLGTILMVAFTPIMANRVGLV